MQTSNAEEPRTRHLNQANRNTFEECDKLEGSDQPREKCTSGAHGTLKYSLLGPSLTKAGQESVDQSKVSDIIYNASKGSKYFNNEKSKDHMLTGKIERIQSLKRRLEKIDLSSELRKADDYIQKLESTRDLSQIIVHIDCDAFYAAVEELDRPELKHVPMAVGKGVLTTCNYHARKFGCRSGMAGFVAMKLCPHLVCLPLNFDKYSAKAKEVREILADYDPRFESASIDEAYLNLTDYCREKNMDPDDVVAHLRAQVADSTQITISAGIAPNAKIAKICSNRNKPNGQFRVAGDRQAIISFMHHLPTRKVNGVGRVFERELDAIGIKTCGDIYPQRAYLTTLFGEKAFQFLIRCSLGLGRTSVRPAGEYERKSVGTERTFRELSGEMELREKLRSLAEELGKDLTRTQFKGRTLVLKIKLHTFEILTRQIILPKAIHLADDLEAFALPLLAKLEKELPGLRLRLMGLRCTHLVSTKGFDFFGIQKGRSEASTSEVSGLEVSGFEVSGADGVFGYTRERHEMEEPRDTTLSTCEEDSLSMWSCPVCGRAQKAEDKAVNQHLDHCLSKQTIRETLRSSEATFQECHLKRNSSKDSKRQRFFA